MSNNPMLPQSQAQEEFTAWVRREAQLSDDQLIDIHLALGDAGGKSKEQVYAALMHAIKTIAGKAAGQ